MGIKKIYVVACLHGDEPFGLKVLAHLRQVGDERIIRQVGHPEALAKRKEFLEANLNRSFDPDAPPSKEARIAKHILRDIKTHQPDLILDIHTAECAVGKSAIICQINRQCLDIVKRLGMDYVFENVPSISRQNLVGQNPDKSIILEFGRGWRSDQLALSMAHKIADLLKDKPVPKKKLKVYSKTRCIENKEAAGLKLENYVFNKQLGGYPYLVGNNTYTEYVGFLAQKETLL
ncbi:hypothetical protein A3F65_03265 [Candidatus Saccharibacteria bacterium RIFCSPHIGHO2_12_FULL_47_16b]|nr:MAG: hypothetical protein A3F65_03265 [Candidatus Saccharibacteria bacterium RIFCSPHIGHO2_12_FULL_47_16b]OGL38070.1 MAG: hypothetical protein A3J32_02345 [Candidatus Saccharibacteria bacterium RIFCSPLOWO2_02_FULL_46_7]